MTIMESAHTGGRAGRALREGVLLALAAAISAIGGWVVLSVPAPHGRIPDLVGRHLPDSGVSHPVTAVLLNFRSYDTLLEVAVLLVAGWIARAFVSLDESGPPRAGDAGPVVVTLVRYMVPVAVLVGVALVWAGSFRPGGAFQGGAVLAGAGIMVALAWPDALRQAGPRVRRMVFAAGLAAFLLAAAWPLLAGRSMLELAAGSAGAWILVVELAIFLSVAESLVTLAVGAATAAGEPDGNPPQHLTGGLS